MVDDPLGDAELYNAVTGVTLQQRLRWASEAQYELQKETRAVTRSLEIETDDLRNGKVQIDDDIWMVTLCELVQEESHRIIATVEARSYNELRRMQRLSQSPATPPQCQYFFAYHNRKLHFWPVPSSGEFIVTYNPFLLPYTSTRGDQTYGDWANCTGDTINDFIKETGPEQEFWTEIEAMKAYAAQKIMGASGLVRMYAYKYKEYGVKWERALADIRTRMPDYSQGDPAATNNELPR